MVPLEGPVGIGAWFDAIMFGCVIVQSCVYYKNSEGDPWLSKVLVSRLLSPEIDRSLEHEELMEIHKVLLISFLLLSHLGCVVAWLWASTEVNAVDESLLAAILFGVSSVCGAVISFLERCFFSHRIMKASNNNLLTFVFFVSCTFSFTAALGAATVFFPGGTAGLANQFSNIWVFPLVFISGLVCDLAINIVTAFYLKSQTPMDVADALGRITGLLILVAETSAVTSLFGVAALIVYWLTRTNFAWVGLFVAMPGVFANTLLAALNVRGQLCADIKHKRTSDIEDKLVDKRVKKPPIMIVISKQLEK